MGGVGVVCVVGAMGVVGVVGVMGVHGPCGINHRRRHRLSSESQLFEAKCGQISGRPLLRAPGTLSAISGDLMRVAQRVVITRGGLPGTTMQKHFAQSTQRAARNDASKAIAKLHSCAQLLGATNPG